jgi:hypothetical protein
VRGHGRISSRHPGREDGVLIRQGHDEVRLHLHQLGWVCSDKCKAVDWCAPVGSQSLINEVSWQRS